MAAPFWGEKKKKTGPAPDRNEIVQRLLHQALKRVKTGPGHACLRGRAPCHELVSWAFSYQIIGGAVGTHPADKIGWLFPAFCLCKVSFLRRRGSLVRGGGHFAKGPGNQFREFMRRVQINRRKPWITPLRRAIPRYWRLTAAEVAGQFRARKQAPIYENRRPAVAAEGEGRHRGAYLGVFLQGTQFVSLRYRATVDVERPRLLCWTAWGAEPVPMRFRMMFLTFVRPPSPGICPFPICPRLAFAEEGNSVHSAGRLKRKSLRLRIGSPARSHQ